MRHSLLALACALATASSALSQVVAVYNGGPPVPADVNDDLLVNVGQVTTDSLLRVFDVNSNSSTPPARSLRSLTIQGTVSGNGRLRVLIANGSATAFPNVTEAGEPLDVGLVTLGTAANNQGGISFNDNALRDASVLALSVSGDIHGRIEVGRVFRIQALGTTNPQTGVVTGGHVTAAIFATAGDASANPTLGEMSIGVITAYDGITGNITAGQATLTERLNIGSIGRITVTSPATNPVPTGIAGKSAVAVL